MWAWVEYILDNKSKVWVQSVCNSYWPIPEVCMQYRSTDPEGKAKGWVFLYCMQSEGLVNNYFLAHCFLDTVNMLLALKNSMNVCSRPQELYNSKHVDMSPTRRDYITCTVPRIPHSNGLESIKVHLQFKGAVCVPQAEKHWILFKIHHNAYNLMRVSMTGIFPWWTQTL